MSTDAIFAFGARREAIVAAMRSKPGEPVLLFYSFRPQVIRFDRAEALRIAEARRLDREAEQLLDREPNARAIREAARLKERARAIRRLLP